MINASGSVTQLSLAPYQLVSTLGSKQEEWSLTDAGADDPRTGADAKADPYKTFYPFFVSDPFVHRLEIALLC